MAARKLALAMTLWAASATAQPATPTPFGQVVSRCACVVRNVPGDLASATLADFATLVDDGRFLVAFRLWSERDTWPDPPIRLALYAPQSGTWHRGNIAIDESRDHGGPLGTLSKESGHFVIERRVAIDGFSKIFVAPDLTKRGGVYHGGDAPLLPNGLVFYQHAQPHFAPTHYVEMALLDTRTGEEREVYPPRPHDPVRSRFVEAVRERWSKRGEAWFREHNHHQNPEWFDSSAQNLTVNWAARTVAFSVHYTDRDFFNAADVPIAMAVVVTCDGLESLQTAACRETPLSAWQAILPGASDTELLRTAAANPRRVLP